MPITHVEIESEKIFKPKRKRSKLKIFLSVVLVIFVVALILITSLAVYFYPKVKVLSADLAVTGTRVEAVQKAVKEQDVVKAKKENDNLQTDLRKTKEDLGKLSLAGKLPLVSGYYNDAEHLLNAAILGTKAGDIVANSIQPFSDILGLKGAKSNLKAEDKVEVLVTQVFPALSPQATELGEIIKEVKTELDQVSESRYPEGLTVRGYKVRGSLVIIKNTLNQAEAFVPSLKNALEVLPATLGYQEEKTYLLLFQNDKELRATGGFLTAYAIARVKNGKLLDIQSGDIYDLDKRFVPFEPPPEPLKKYLGMQIYAIRDTNISPDFKVSAQKFESYYNRISGVPKVDGIIAIDTEAVRKFLEVTGPVTTKKYHETFSAEINKKYNIPDVVYKLELYAEKILLQSSERKGIIGDLMDSMLGKLLSAPPEKFPSIFTTFLKANEEKNILFYMHNEKAQGLVEDLNWAGRIKDFDGDYLHVNNSNFGGLKGNLYIKEQIDQDIVVAADGTVTKKTVITLKNTGRADGWLNSVYQNWMRVFVPGGSRLIDKTVPSDFAENQEFNKESWESFSRVYPLKSSETLFTYELPFKVKKGSLYKLLIQKQPGTTDPHMVISLNGKKIREFDLKKDTEIEFKI